MQVNAALSASGSGATSPLDRDRTTVASDFETFLKMMTTQLQNQDPLNPIDSSDYAVQLATFSGVEQQTKTNQLLEAMQTQFGMLGMAQMATWVGSEARAAMPGLITDGQAIALSPNPIAGVDRVVMVVTNAEGEVVNRVDLPKDATEYEWTPVDIEEAPLPDGLYTFTLENYRNGEQLEDTAVELYGRITEVRGGASGMTLLMEGGAEVSVAAVTALRE